MLCELITVKNRLKLPLSDTTDDTILTYAILSSGRRFEAYCQRYFARSTGFTVEFDAGWENICPKLYPIESVTEFALKENETDGFVVQSDVSYRIVQADGGEKCVIQLLNPLGTAGLRGRVTLTGGYVLPADFDLDSNFDPIVTDPQTALPEDIEQACVEQVCYWYQNRHRLGIVTQNVEGGGIRMFRELDLLPSVKGNLANYVRIQL